MADKGEGGEKENAKIKLRELLERYNIKKFEEKASKKRVFKLADFNDCKTIMIHCIIDTLKSAKIEGYKAKKEIYCKLTDEQYAFVTIPTGEKIEFKPYSDYEDGHNVFLMAEYKENKYRIDTVPSIPLVFIYLISGNRLNHVEDFYPFTVIYDGFSVDVRKSF